MLEFNPLIREKQDPGAIVKRLKDLLSNIRIVEREDIRSIVSEGPNAFELKLNW